MAQTPPGIDKHPFCCRNGASSQVERPKGATKGLFLALFGSYLHGCRCCRERESVVVESRRFFRTGYRYDVVLHSFEWRQPSWNFRYLLVPGDCCDCVIRPNCILGNWWEMARWEMGRRNWINDPGSTKSWVTVVSSSLCFLLFDRRSFWTCVLIGCLQGIKTVVKVHFFGMNVHTANWVFFTVDEGQSIPQLIRF